MQNLLDDSREFISTAQQSMVKKKKKADSQVQHFAAARDIHRVNSRLLFLVKEVEFVYKARVCLTGLNE